MMVSEISYPPPPGEEGSSPIPSTQALISVLALFLNVKSILGDGENEQEPQEKRAQLGYGKHGERQLPRDSSENGSFLLAVVAGERPNHSRSWGLTLSVDREIGGLYAKGILKICELVVGSSQD
jgi:hypothetical protein